MNHGKSRVIGSWMTNLPELGTNLIPTLSTLDMKNLSHGAAEREGKKEFSFPPQKEHKQWVAERWEWIKEQGEKRKRERR